MKRHDVPVGKEASSKHMLPCKRGTCQEQGRQNRGKCVQIEYLKPDRRHNDIHFV